MTEETSTTPRWALPLVCLLAIGAGVGAWTLFRRAGTAAGESSGARGGTPRRSTGSPESSDVVADPAKTIHDQAASLLVDADKLPPAARAAKVQEAHDLIERLERMSPSDPEVHFWRGLAGVVGQDRAVAEGALTRLQSMVSPKDPRAPYLQAQVILTFDPDRGDDALKAARRARALDPGFMPQPVLIAQFRALMVTATKLLNQRSPDYAVQNLRDAAAIAKALDHPVDLLLARRSLAVAFQRGGRWLEAQEAWEALAKEHPEVADFEFGLANALAFQHKWAEAVPRFTRVLEAVEQGRVPAEQVPSLREARLRRGNCYRLLQKPDEARADVERYVADIPEDGRGWYWLGKIHFDSLDDPAAALPFLEKARALLPWCDEPLRALLQIHEVAIPDEAKAQALRKELEDGAEARKKDRERVAKEREGNLCE